MKKSQYLFTGLILSILLLAAGCASPLAQQSSNTLTADAAATKDTTDKRITLTPDNIDEYNPTGEVCLKFNQNEPTTTANYSNTDKGISLDLPYNPDWGNETYSINAYDLTKYGSLQFGPIISGVEGCGWVRMSSLSFVPQQSAAEVIKKINEQNAIDLGPNPAIPAYVAEQYTINGMTAVKYQTGELCTSDVIVIIGEKYNYELSQGCSVEADFAKLETIAKTIKFLPLTTSLVLPTSCTSQSEGAPVITALSSSSGPVGTKLEIKGCNFSGFEGDKNIWMVNNKGEKGIVYGDLTSTSSLMSVVLTSPLCQDDNSYKGGSCEHEINLAPGEYKIYTEPWGKKSNEATFIITLDNY